MRCGSDLTRPAAACKRLRPSLALAAVLAVPPYAAGGSNPNMPLDRPYTLRNAEPFGIEAEYHRMLSGDRPRSYIFPRPCISEVDSSSVCDDDGLWEYRDSSKARSLVVSPAAGYEIRHSGDVTHAVDFGLSSHGHSGPLSYRVDGGMFTEIGGDWDAPSFDREFLERQDEAESGSIAYRSYSRYRSDLSYDWNWGRLTVARDAAHWGPGLMENLTFNQEAIPFNQVTFTTHLGPLSVRSLYGQLAADTNWAFDTAAASRSVYAHRYEWRMTRDIVLGVSEQLVMYKRESPFAFVPVVPLYISKAMEKERLNNGNISMDASWRIRGMGAVYTEFMIDDIQSPTSLFGDAWGNKWAWMGGIHLIRGAATGRMDGLVMEFVRIEPWVYTHYLPNTAQAANFGHPLGNPLGPDAMQVTAKAYSRLAGRFYAGLRVDATWRGDAPGSGIGDVRTKEMPETKEFLSGSPDARWSASPTVSVQLGRAALLVEGRVGGDAKAAARLQTGW